MNDQGFSSNYLERSISIFLTNPSHHFSRLYFPCPGVFDLTWTESLALRNKDNVPGQGQNEAGRSIQISVVEWFYIYERHKVTVIRLSVPICIKRQFFKRCGFKPDATYGDAVKSASKKRGQSTEYGCSSLRVREVSIKERMTCIGLWS